MCASCFYDVYLLFYLWPAEVCLSDYRIVYGKVKVKNNDVFFY